MMVCVAGFQRHCPERFSTVLAESGAGSHSLRSASIVTMVRVSAVVMAGEGPAAGASSDVPDGSDGGSSEGCQDLPVKFSSVLIRRYCGCAVVLKYVRFTSVDWDRRSFPSEIMGSSRELVPDLSKREPCGKEPSVKPGMMTGTRAMTSTTAAPSMAAREKIPLEKRTPVARTFPSGAYHWQQPRMRRNPAAAPTKPIVPMPPLVVKAGGNMIRTNPIELAAGMARVIAAVSMRSATNPSPAHSKKNRGSVEGTGVLLVIMVLEASDAIVKAAVTVPGVGMKPSSEEFGKNTKVKLMNQPASAPSGA